MEINMKPYNLENFKKKEWYEWDDIIDIIQDMESEIFELKCKNEELEYQLEHNYKKIDVQEQYEISERDFI